MARYIDADSIPFYLHKGWDLFIADKQDIDKIPTADVVEVKHGEWLPTNDDNKKLCSRCDVIHLIAQYPNGQANYCPNCGAKWTEVMRYDL